MSHFTVMVVVDGKHPTAEDAWDAVQAALAPYDENLEVPEDVWLDEETVQRYVAHYKENPDDYWYQPTTLDPTTRERVNTGPRQPLVPPLDQVAEGDLDAFNGWLRKLIGYNENGEEHVLYDEEEGRWGYRSFYNPKSKWDWYSLGGRWSGALTLKAEVDIHGQSSGMGGHYSETQQEKLQRINDRRVDLARAGDIDWVTASAEAVVKANQDYDAFEAAVGDLEPPPTWEEFRKAKLREAGVEDVDQGYRTQPAEWERGMAAARAEYGQHPWVRALRKSNLDAVFGDSVADWCVHTGGRERYVARAEASIYTTYALLTLTGEWVAPGDMGWWGMSSDTPEEKADFQQQQMKYVQDLPGDAWIAIVDCHI